MKTIEVFVNYPPHLRNKQAAYLRLDIDINHNRLIAPDHLYLATVKYALSQLLLNQCIAFQVQINFVDEIYHLTWYKNKLIKS